MAPIIQTPGFRTGSRAANGRVMLQSWKASVCRPMTAAASVDLIQFSSQLPVVYYHQGAVATVGINQPHWTLGPRRAKPPPTAPPHTHNPLLGDVVSCPDAAPSDWNIPRIKKRRRRRKQEAHDPHPAAQTLGVKCIIRATQGETQIEVVLRTKPNHFWGLLFGKCVIKNDLIIICFASRLFFFVSVFESMS